MIFFWEFRLIFLTELFRFSCSSLHLFVSLPSSSSSSPLTTMQSSLLLRARAPLVTAPRRGAAVKPLAATAVPTEVNSPFCFLFSLEVPETAIRGSASNASRPGLVVDASIDTRPLKQSCDALERTRLCDG